MTDPSASDQQFAGIVNQLKGEPPLLKAARSLLEQLGCSCLIIATALMILSISLSVHLLF